MKILVEHTCVIVHVKSKILTFIGTAKALNPFSAGTAFMLMQTGWTSALYC